MLCKPDPFAESGSVTNHMAKINQDSLDASVVARAQGCLLGQLAGDALGSLVEFQTPEHILPRTSRWCSESRLTEGPGVVFHFVS